MYSPAIAFFIQQIMFWGSFMLSHEAEGPILLQHCVSNHGLPNCSTMGGHWNYVQFQADTNHTARNFWERSPNSRRLTKRKLKFQRGSSDLIKRSLLNKWYWKSNSCCWAYEYKGHLKSPFGPLVQNGIINHQAEVLTGASEFGHCHSPPSALWLPPSSPRFTRANPVRPSASVQARQQERPHRLSCPWISTCSFCIHISHGFHLLKPTCFGTHGPPSAKPAEDANTPPNSPSSRLLTECWLSPEDSASGQATSPVGPVSVLSPLHLFSTQPPECPFKPRPAHSTLCSVPSPWVPVSLWVAAKALARAHMASCHLPNLPLLLGLHLALSLLRSPGSSHPALPVIPQGLLRPLLPYCFPQASPSTFNVLL